MAQIMYGAGLRVTEVHRLWVQDFDIDNGQIDIRDSNRPELSGLVTFL